MFSSVPMRRLQAVVLARSARTVLRQLGLRGAIQLTTIPSLQTAPPGRASDRSRELAKCDRLLAQVAEVRRSLGLGARAMAGAASVSAADAEQALAEICSRVRSWATRRGEADRRLAELDGAARKLRPYAEAALPLDARDPSSLVHFVTGTLPSGALERLDLPDTAAVVPLPAAEKYRERVVVMATREQQAALQETLGAAGFQREDLPALPGQTVASAAGALQREQENLAQERQALDHEREELARTAAALLDPLDHEFQTERRLCEAEQLLPGTGSTVVISGWVPATAVAAVRKELEAASGAICALEFADPTGVPEQEIPILLGHGRWLHPFQGLVTAYGFPRYTELVPTLFVALSYVLMFGMMFGDVGHGGLLVLAGAGVWLARKGRNLAILLLANGLSSASFGVVYGSYFGVPFLKEQALWHDPLEGDPMTLMLMAIGIGVVLMSLGLGLNIANRLRHGDLGEALLDKFGVLGVLFYWSALVLTIRLATLRPRSWWDGVLLVGLALPLLGWAVKEPLLMAWRRQPRHTLSGGAIATAGLESLVGAFEGVLLYLANTISFVRLAAYAMSHAALLMATFTLADQVREGGPAGPVLAGLVIVLGNVIAMVLEGIVAAVQALRLEYYEFFGKFFAGDGQPFRPFALEPTH